MSTDNRRSQALREWQAVIEQLPEDERQWKKKDFVQYRYPYDLPDLTKDVSANWDVDFTKMEMVYRPARTEKFDLSSEFAKFGDVYLRTRGKFAVFSDKTVLQFD